MELLYSSHWILTALLALPLLGAVVCQAAPERNAGQVALWVTVLEFALSVPLFFAFETGTAGFQNYVAVPWIASWGIQYAVGVDGISLLLVLLTTLTMPLAVASSFRSVDRHEKAYYTLMLLLQTGMLGVFTALDLFLFYVFWEVMLIPMYFLIGIWGGDRRIYSAIKFFLFTAVGSLLMLVAIAGLVYLYHQQTGTVSFAYRDLVQLQIARGAQFWLFGAFALAFAIKVPLFPLHTWLPDAHVEAPTAGSVILAGVLLKTGIYGFLRFGLPFFSHAATHPAVVGTFMTLGLVGILYAAWVAAVQPDVKSLIAYTSIAHLGFVVLGIFALNTQGMEGGILQMVNHGLSTGALFLLVGMIYERRHTRLIEEFGGLARSMPEFSLSFVVVALSSIGLPATNGFVGEFLILLGTFRSHPIVAVVAATGVVFAAYYMLPMVQRVVWNPLDRDENEGLEDLTGRERAIIAPLLALIVLIGVYPNPFLDRTSASAGELVRRVEKRAAAEPLARGANVAEVAFESVAVHREEGAGARWTGRTAGARAPGSDGSTASAPRRAPGAGGTAGTDE